MQWMVHHNNTWEEQGTAAFHIKGDLTSTIMKFLHDLDNQEKLCHDIGVPAADATKIQYYIKSMFASNQFDDKEMQAYKVKPTINKTWESTKAHFVELYKSKEKFNAKGVACTGGYESATAWSAMAAQAQHISLKSPPPSLLPLDTWEVTCIYYVPPMYHVNHVQTIFLDTYISTN